MLVQKRVGRIDFAYISVRDLFMISSCVDILNEADELNGWIKHLEGVR
ncbi:MAG: hypothetical protein ACREBS_00880 [Nitrososphaerales archaeon]